jgi:excisionase family DNA binding protein
MNTDTLHAHNAALTVDEAISELGTDSKGKPRIGRSAFYAAIRRREVPHLRLGKRIIIPRAAFLRWLEGAAAGVVTK